MVGQCQHAAMQVGQQHGSTSLPCGRLQATGVGSIYLDLTNRQRHTKSSAQFGAGVAPRLRTRHQPVADMNGAHLDPELTPQMSKHMRQH